MIADLKSSVLVGVSDFLGQQVRGSKMQRVELVPALVDQHSYQDFPWQTWHGSFFAHNYVYISTP